MKKSKLLCIVLLFALILCSCGEQAVESSKESKPTEEITPKYQNLMVNISPENVSSLEDLSQGNKAYQDFALKVFKESLSKEGKNTLISPLSVIYALGLTANGADGNTLSQMEEVFGIKIDPLNEYLYSYAKQKEEKTEAKLNIANSIWFTDNENLLKINNEFLQKNANYYKAAANKADFSDEQTLKDINNWVKEKTDGAIEEIISKIEANDVMFLINALSFEAEWREKYTEGSVRAGEFITENGEKIETEFMHSNVSIYLSDDNSVGFMKEYKGGYAFAALLPKEGMTIEEYVSTLSGDKISNILNSKSNYETITSLPKFETEYDISMVKVFQRLGMTDAFENANFSKMGEADELKIGDILHKTFISVGELGTKAGAATAVIMEAEGEPAEIKYVNLSRPFVYMLVDTTTNTPIFIGTMMNPAQ